MEKWDKNIFWVMQKFVYDNMVNRFRLTDLDHNTDHSTQFHIYDLVRNKEVYNLQLIDKKSTTIANLLKAFTHQPTPSLDDFVEVLEEKIKLKLGLIIE
jgi:hypothetical protein